MTDNTEIPMIAPTGVDYEGLRTLQAYSLNQARINHTTFSIDSDVNGLGSYYADIVLRVLVACGEEDIDLATHLQERLTRGAV